jgi:hypothetical protein
LVSAFVGVLIGLCSTAAGLTDPEREKQVKELVTRCLGEIGALDSQVLNRNGNLALIVARQKASLVSLGPHPTAQSLPVSGAGVQPFDFVASPTAHSGPDRFVPLRRASSGAAAGSVPAPPAPETVFELDYANAHHFRRHHTWILRAFNAYLSHSEAHVIALTAETARAVFRGSAPARPNQHFVPTDLHSSSCA